MTRAIPFVFVLLCAACATPLTMSGKKKNPVPVSKPAAALPATGAKNESAQAAELLSRINSYTNMSDAHYARVQQATEHLAAGRAKATLDLLRPLETELRSATKTYVVKTGDSLWSIAAQSEIYANGQLWPLLARANADLLSKTAYQVQVGQRLAVRLHPTMQESIQAIRDNDKVIAELQAAQR